jgi:hypothetical protein
LPHSWTVQWDLFLDIDNHSNLQKSRQIDTRLSFNLGQLPLPLERAERQSLATHDLLRGYRMGLPSGQAIAQVMEQEPLDGPETPLWYYILREAKEKGGGRRLGPVGGRIVAEVIIGLLAGDPDSFLSVDPGWQPTRFSGGDKFELQDIFYKADVPLTEQRLDEKLHTDDD